MKLILLFIIIVVWASSGNAQTTITISKHFGGIHYHVEDRRISPREAFKRIKVNPEAARMFRTGRPRRAIASLFAAVGGFTVGYHIARSTASQRVRSKANWPHMAFGAALIGASVPLYNSYSRRAEKAVEMFNDGIPYSFNSSNVTSFSLSAKNRGLALEFNF